MEQSNVRKDRIMKEIKFKLTEEDLKILDEALVQLPYYKVAELIGKLNEQISEEVVEK